MTENTSTTLNEKDDLSLLLSSGLFDRDWYLAVNPDVVEAKIDPAIHFLQYGGVEGRSPGPGFSSKWYLDTYEDVKTAGVNPLVHYLKYGKDEGRTALSCKEAEDLLLIESSDLFNWDWYLEKNPDVAGLKINPAFHYLYYGGFEGRDPGERFSSSWYLDVYEDVKRSGLNPLVHYLRYGQGEGRYTQSQRNTFRETGRQKVFCIGFNKTGTTSIELVLKNFGYIVGRQMEAELLMDDWVVRDFRKIIEYCQTADAFQDVPFSLDFTYQVLDQAFPNSKFILTVRNSAEEWYQSLVRFHAKIVGVTGVPTANDLKNASYRNKGWLWHQHQYIFGADENTLYDETLYMSCYTAHNRQILEYFKYRPNDLLVLNLAEPSSMQSLCEFLGIKYDGETMPHLNRSDDLEALHVETQPALRASLYDTIYTRFLGSATLKAIWRSVYADEYPEEVGFPFSFVTKAELKKIVSSLSISSGDRFVDIACGQGGVSVWVAQQTGASVIGVDYSQVAIQSAMKHAIDKGVQDSATFIQCDAEDTNIPDSSLDGAISIDSLQLMPNPVAVMMEVLRILKSGAKFIFTAWAIHKPPFPGRMAISDYRPLLEKAGFIVDEYDELENWRQKQLLVYHKILENADALKHELGEEASAILLDDATHKPSQLPDYSRILVVARKR